jgi:hypothetical protein
MPDETDSVIIDTSNSLGESSRAVGEGLASITPAERDIDIIKTERRIDFIGFRAVESEFLLPRPERSATLALDMKVLGHHHLYYNIRSSTGFSRYCLPL